MSTSWFLVLQVEAGNAWYNPDDAAIDDLLYTGSIGMVATTMFGPLSFVYGRAVDGNDAGYITLGAVRDPLRR